MTSSPDSSTPAAGAPRRAIHFGVAAILTIAALVRLAHLVAVKDAPFIATLIVDSREYDRWAQEIADGDWLGTRAFFQAPFYPYFLAVVYALFGHRLPVVYAIQIALAIAGCWALYRAGKIVAGPPLGLAAAALAALYGPFVFHDVLLLKESLAVTTVCFLLWALESARTGSLAGAALETRRPAAGVIPWLVAGALLGVLALLRENALLLAPVLTLLAVPPRRGLREAGRIWLRHAAAFLLGFVALLLPVAARNLALGGGFLPTTFQGGVNLYIGNNPDADGTYRPLVPGRQVPALEAKEAVRIAEQAAGSALRPARVSAYWTGRVAEWARADPAAFWRLQWRKLRLFWSWYEWPDAVDYYDFRTRSRILAAPLVEFGAIALLAVLGLALAGPWRSRLLPALVFAGSWMLATIVFFLFSRYRLPAVPALILLAAVPFARAWDWRRTAKGAAVGIAALAALAAPHLGTPWRPRLDLVEGNLGRLAAETGRPDEAAAHYRRVLEVAPEDLGALLGLGAQAARAADWQRAAELFGRAARAAPDSSDAAASLGGVYLVLGRLEDAAVELQRALRLDSENPLARRNLEILEGMRRQRAGDAAAPGAGSV